MGFVQSLIIVLLASQAAIAATVAGERTTEPAAVRVQKNSGHHATKDARMTAATPLDRVAIAVEGAESSHGKDIGMWRPNPSGPQGPMQVSEAAAMDVGGGDRFELTQNRAIGRAYLAQLYGRYGNWPDAIAAYNWGLGKMDAWVKAGRPPDRFLVGVATYLSRVLHDTGLCNGTEPKRLRQSAGTADRSDAREAAPNASTYSICAHFYSGRSSIGLDKAIVVGLDGLLIFDGRRLRLDETSQGLLSGPWRPLTAAQRLTLQRRLARAEFLARIGLRKEDTSVGHGW